MLEFGTEPDWNIEIPFLARIPKDTLKNLPVQGRDGPLVGSGSLFRRPMQLGKTWPFGPGQFPLWAAKGLRGTAGNRGP